jgi:hypothetical protein
MQFQFGFLAFRSEAQQQFRVGLAAFKDLFHAGSAAFLIPLTSACNCAAEVVNYQENYEEEEDKFFFHLLF